VTVVGRRRLLVIVNVDMEPQPYFRLERAIVEAGQQFGLVRGFTPPQAVAGLGLDASWFPDQSKLMTTDGTRLISATVLWPRAGQRRSRDLAVVAARHYLGKLQPNAADPNGT
jgi:hypothetical protein